MLYPGNVVNVVFKAVPTYTLFATLSCGDTILENTPIYSSIDHGVTDSSGFVQIDIAKDDVLKFFDRELDSVYFSTSGIEDEGGFSFVDLLSCSDSDQYKAVQEGSLKTSAKNFVAFEDSKSPRLNLRSRRDEASANAKGDNGSTI